MIEREASTFVFFYDIKGRRIDIIVDAESRGEALGEDRFAYTQVTIETDNLARNRLAAQFLSECEGILR